MSTLEFSQLLGNYGEFVGAIAIVITLIYLAVQLRQNTASVRSSAYQTWVAVSGAEFSAVQSMPSVVGTGMDNPSSLTNENWLQFSSYCHQFVMKAEAMYYLRKEGIIAASISEKEIDRACKFLAAPGPAQWWSAGARTQFSGEFVAMIEHWDSGEMQQYWFTPGQGFHPYITTAD